MEYEIFSSHLGVLDQPEVATPSDTQILEIPGSKGYVFATHTGVFEPLHDKGDHVEANMVAGLIHNLLDPAEPPRELLFSSDGWFTASAIPAGSARATAAWCLPPLTLARFNNWT